MKKLFITLLAAMCLVSCSDNNTLKINVNLQNAKGKTVYLKKYVNENLVTTDSVVMKKDNVVFKVNKGENSDAYFINVENWKRPLTFFIDNQDVMITGDYQNYNQIKVQAGERQDKIIALDEQLNSIEDETELMYEAMRFVKENHTDAIGAYALYRYKWAFANEDQLKLLESFENVNSGYIKLMKKYIIKVMSVSVGNKCLDFKQEAIDGGIFVLSEFVENNNLTMIDFWASWCPDCRKENPNVVAVYNAFKDKGFDVVSVSLDTDKAAWQKAVADDNLTWKNHTGDLKGWNNKVADMYCIAFIPQNVLIDKDGVIVARNLSGEELMNFVNDYLK